MWKKEEAGKYTYKNYTVMQVSGLGWCLLKDDKGVARFKTLARAKNYVQKSEGLPTPPSTKVKFEMSGRAYRTDLKHWKP